MGSVLRMVFPLLAVAALLAFFPRALGAQTINVPWPLEGTGLGHGYDIHLGEFKNEPCVAVKSKPAARGAALGLQHFELEDIRSRSDLSKRLSESLQAQGQMKAFRASARKSFVESISISQAEAAIALLVQVTGTQDIAELGVGPFHNAQELNNPEKFRARCGTHYVSSVTKGGELLLLMKSYVSKKEEASQFYSEVKAASTEWSAKQEKTATTSLRQIESRIRITGHRSGAAGPNPYTLNEAVTAYRTFPDEIDKSKGTIIHISLTPYPSTVVDTSWAAELDAAVERLLDYEYLQAHADRVLASPELFDIAPGTIEVLARFSRELRAKGVSLRQDIKECAFSIARKAWFKRSCRRLAKYENVPVNTESTLPSDLGARCGQRNVRLTDVTVGQTEFGKEKGDDKVGPDTAVFDISARTTLQKQPPRVMLTMDLLMRQTWGSRNPNELDHHRARLWKELEHDAAGCALDPAQWKERSSGQKDIGLHRLGPQELILDARSGDLVDKLSCSIGAPPDRRGGPQAKVTQRPKCTVVFKPLVGVVIVPIGLLDSNGEARPRRSFERPGWLK